LLKLQFIVVFFARALQTLVPVTDPNNRALLKVGDGTRIHLALNAAHPCRILARPP